MATATQSTPWIPFRQGGLISAIVRRAWAMALVLGGLAAGIRAEEPVADTSARTTTTERGFSYRNDQRQDPAWSVNVFKVDRSRKDLFLTSTTGLPDRIGMSTVAEQIQTLPASWGTPIAAVNGDFYTTEDDYRGDPRDVQIRNGELISAPAGHASFWMDAAGEPRTANVESNLRVRWPDGTYHPLGLNELRDSEMVVLYSSAIGRSTRSSGGVELVLTNAPGEGWLPLQVGRTIKARVASVHRGGDTPVPRDGLVLSIGSRMPESARNRQPGDEIQLEFKTTPDLSGVETALGGGPTLVRSGKPQTWSNFQIRHPRSAMGWNKTHFFLVQVDGRQPDLSVGMTFPELAKYMAELGCEEAINLDGGGSATMWVLGQVVNSPSEGRQRPGANALVVMRRPGVSEARRP